VSLSFYNAVPNVFWSLLGFAPVSILCYRFMERVCLWAFVAISLLVAIVPASRLRDLELSTTATAYQRLGVYWVNGLVQHGSLVNRLLRRTYPGYRRMRSRTGSPYLLQSTYVQERFHWTMLLFFLLSSLYGSLMDTQAGPC
jgi:hypothetical protein